MTEISVRMQQMIETLNEENGLLDVSLANATDRIAELEAENAKLRQQITRLESGNKQTVWAWEGECK